MHLTYLGRAAFAASWLLLLGLVQGADPNMKRSLNLSYGIQGGPAIKNITQSQITKYIGMIQPNASSVISFLLNVEPKNLYLYNVSLNYFNTSNIPMYPGIGKQTAHQIDSAYFKDIARGYRTWTDCIQLNNVQAYSEEDGTNGIARINSMIDFLNNTLKYQHIQMNAWPFEPDHKTPYSFANPAVDSAQEQVQLNASKTSPYTVYSDPTNWEPNYQRIKAILAVKPDVQIVINYEDKPEEASLTTLTTEEQLQAFQITINNITNTYGGANGHVHWNPPWSQNYDPIAQGTYDFIVNQLNKGNP